LLTDLMNISDKWGEGIAEVQHDLNENALFSLESLAELIRQNPDCVSEAATMNNSREDASTWRDAGIANAPSNELIDAIQNGSIWANLGKIGERDSRYQTVVDQIMDQIENEVPGLATFNRQIGILISSPNARVFYHADVPGQALLHISGEKRIWLYPGEEPYLNQRDFEKVVTHSTAEEITYDPSFEKVATVYDLTPGAGLFWPLNWPHRVVNGNTVNISATVEYSTKTTRRHFNVNYANGMLSHVFGYRPRSQAIEGAGFWSKVMMSYALRRSGIGPRLVQSMSKTDTRSNSAVPETTS